MEDGNVEQLLEPLLDHEAVRRLDVLEIDPAETRSQIAHGIDEGIDILCVDEQVHGIDIGKALEERALAFHDRLRGLRAEIAEAENGRAVRDHGHKIALVRVVVGARLVLGDREHRHGDTRRIGEREVALGGQRLGRCDLELAGLTLGVETERVVGGKFDRGRVGGHEGISPSLVRPRDCPEGR